jgi:hypothetical protein
MMNRIHAHRSAAGGCALLALAAVALGVGCAGPAYEEPVAAAPPPPPGYAQAPAPPPPGYAEAPAPPPPAEPAPPPPVQPVDDTVATDVVYEPDPPFVDIETYPSVVYLGAPVYFVGGRWYRHDARGWGYFRAEPPELAHNRALHERDPRWVRARQVRPRAPAPRRGVTAPQPPDRRR